MLIAGGRLVTADGVVPDSWVRFEDGVVAETGTGDAPQDLHDTVDTDGLLLAPGFVDLHVHGGGGADLMEGSGAARRMLATHRAHGTTRSVLSLVSAPVPELVRLLEAFAPVVRADPLLLGVHLEGPFLAAERRGAHAAEHLVAPSADAVRALLDAADGTLAQVTLAPELPGAARAIRGLRGAGVVVAVGHTGTDLAGAAAAFDAGATLLTHAFNAMPGLHHREPGPVGAALSDERVTLEVVADGEHVHPVVLAALFRAAPGRVALVTDAMAAAGASDGVYRLGALDVTVQDGLARSADGTLAGSTLTMDEALRRAVAAGVPLADAVTAATATPARAIGRPDLGALQPGVAADAVLLDDALRVRAVWAGGRRVR